MDDVTKMSIADKITLLKYIEVNEDYLYKEWTIKNVNSLRDLINMEVKQLVSS